MVLVTFFSALTLSSTKRKDILAFKRKFQGSQSKRPFSKKKIHTHEVIPFKQTTVLFKE